MKNIDTITNVDMFFKCNKYTKGKKNPILILEHYCIIVYDLTFKYVRIVDDYEK